MGRITESFRTRFQKQIQLLKNYRKALLDPSRRTAFHNLLKMWSSEQGAMSYAAIPLALDIMMVTATLDNRKRIQELEGQVIGTTLKLKQIQQLFEKRLSTQTGAGNGTPQCLAKKRQFIRRQHPQH